MITLKNVGKNYGEKKALSEVTLSIEKGEMIAVMGPSGSGKTTLLNIIGCMDRMDEGEYLFDDTDVSSLKGSRLDKFRAENVGFVFQQFALLKDYSIRENIGLPLRARGLSKKERRQLEDEYLEKLGISDVAEKVPPKCSGGQQQRCAIGRAIIAGVSLILADEPTGALDRATGDEVMKLFCDLNREGKTVIVVTHDSHVASYAGRIIRIEDGRVAE